MNSVTFYCFSFLKTGVIFINTELFQQFFFNFSLIVLFSTLKRVRLLKFHMAYIMLDYKSEILTDFKLQRWIKCFSVLWVSKTFSSVLLWCFFSLFWDGQSIPFGRQAGGSNIMLFCVRKIEFDSELF